MTKIITIFLVVVLIFSVTACGGDGEKFDWSDMELSNMLPEPESNLAEIQTNLDNELWITIFKITENQYKDYIKACEAQGFTVDSEENSISYNAYNREGYNLDLTFSFNSIMRIAVCIYGYLSNKLSK